MELDDFDFDLVVGETRIANLNITNYGLIAANNVKISATYSSSYQVIPSITSLAILAAAAWAARASCSAWAVCSISWCFNWASVGRGTVGFEVALLPKASVTLGTVASALGSHGFLAGLLLVSSGDLFLLAATKRASPAVGMMRI